MTKVLVKYSPSNLSIMKYQAEAAECEIIFTASKGGASENRKVSEKLDIVDYFLKIKRILYSFLLPDLKNTKLVS